MPKPCLPTSVWPVAQKTAPSQRKNRYLPASSAHPAKMLPAIARSAVEAYTSPGDVVCDPMCGIGTTLVEAIHLGRDAVGIEYEPRWAEIALANLAHAHANGANGKGEVLVGDGRHLSATIDPALRDLVALVLTSPPYGPSLHGHVHTVAGGGVHKFNNTYSNDPANLGAVGLDELLQAVLDILIGCRRILRPGGIVAMTVRPWRENGRLIDLPGLIGNLADAARLDLFERNVALLAGLRSGRLVPRASFFAMEHARKSRQRGSLPRLVIAHEDVLVFRNSPVHKEPPTRFSPTNHADNWGQRLVSCPYQTAEPITCRTGGLRLDNPAGFEASSSHERTGSRATSTARGDDDLQDPNSAARVTSYGGRK